MKVNSLRAGKSKVQRGRYYSAWSPQQESALYLVPDGACKSRNPFISPPPLFHPHSACVLPLCVPILVLLFLIESSIIQ